MPISSADAALRFAEDLRAAREARGVPLERLYDTSRIPLDVLRNFERDGLSDNRMFNRVYLRSLVRIYADTIGLPAVPVLDALDAALDGRYDGEVAVLASPGSLKAARKPTSEAGADESAPAHEERGREIAGSRGTPDTASATATGEPAIEGANPARGSDRKRRRDDTSAEEAAPEMAASSTIVPETSSVGAKAPSDAAMADVASPAPSKLSILPVPTPERVRVETPAQPRAYSPQIPSPDPSRYAVERERRLPGWAMAALGLLGLVLVASGIAWWVSRDSTPEAPAASAARPTAPRPDSTRRAAPPAPVALPDTLRLVLRANTGPLRGIRVTVDADARRPYWLEQGTERTFAFRDSVRVNEPPAEATLTVQGRPVPASARRPDGTVVIRRADLAAGG